MSHLVRLFLCSWNVGDSKPVNDFVDVLQLDDQIPPDIYILGFQEVDVYDPSAEDNAWSKELLNQLACKGYIRLKVRRLRGLMIIVFVKRSILPYITNVESEATRTGFGGLWGNKGGVSIRFDLYGVNVIFVNSHLAAHLDNAAERITDFNGIIDNQKFRDEDVENILDHDYVFWMGDLNFRLDDVSRDQVLRYIADEKFDKLLENDQLVKCREEKLIFADFNEGKITFPPTYKFDVGTDTYDSSPKQRTPAWCDRVLWLSDKVCYENVELSVEQLHYTSHPAYKISDHKPVTSAFDIAVSAVPDPTSVVFKPLGIVYAGEDVNIMYTVKPEVKTSSSDWIGLYRSDFKSFKDYVTYVWAAPEFDRNSVVCVTMKGSYLRVSSGKYYLCYLTRKYSLLAISKQFKIDDHKD